MRTIFSASPRELPLSMSRRGSGSANAFAVRDAKGQYFDGSRNHKITPLSPVPAKDFWSFVVYDNRRARC